MSVDFLYISSIIIKWHNDEELTASEKIQLENWLDESESNQELFERYSDPDYIIEKLKLLHNVDKDAEWEKLMTAISEERQSVPVTPLSQIGWRRYVGAATVVGVVTIGAWFWINTQSVNRINTPRSIAASLTKDIAPGGNKAVLTLADGSKIVLDSTTGNGTIAQEGNTKIEKLDKGSLAYNSLYGKSANPLVYNTLTTPPAGQFQVTLPDGSKVWLNNASSLRYPTSFTGKSREVGLTGEAYFEIARNTSLPFKVKINDMTVDVLGTSFNIMAYGDESSVKTTLLTGGVRVTRGSITALLKPGEQAQLNGSGEMKVMDNINPDGVVAWKNGFFHFDKADTRSVMRQLARWYDIEVNYEGAVPERSFGGKIGRNLNLSQVLEVLKTNNVNFRVDGRKITVMP